MSALLLYHIRTRHTCLHNKLCALNIYFSTISVQCRQQQPINRPFQCLQHHLEPEISGFHQKGFSKITQQIVGRAVHAVCLKEEPHLSIFHYNTLIGMYSKFGNTEAARHVFDLMPGRNGASWNNMISGFVRMGLYWDAVILFVEMWGFGIQPNGYFIASLLTAFSRLENMVLEGFQIHGLVLKYGLLNDVFVGTSFLHFYGVYGLPFSAKTLFEEMPERNVVTWTSLMVAYSDNGYPEVVIDLYQRMRHEEVSGNENTCTAVISSSLALDDDFLGHQMLGQVVKSGFQDNVSVSNSLISMFGSFGCIEDASYIFEGMIDRDTISWNSIISALAYNQLCEKAFSSFSEMRHVHDDVNSTTLSALLSVCGTIKCLNLGRGVHGLSLKLGWDSNICVCNTLLSMYLEASRPKDAESLFFAMPAKDVISWNSMMAGYVLTVKYFKALEVFAELLHLQRTVNYVTFASALAACSDGQLLLEGKTVHALVIVHGLHDNLIVGNALVTMYGKCGMMLEAKKVFHKMPDKELVTWNALIGGYADNKDTLEAVRNFKSMREEENSPNYITLINVLGSCSTETDLLKYGMPLHGHIILTGFETNEYVRNSLITMYADCGDLDSSNLIFDALLNKTSVTWNAMLAANARVGLWEEALKLLLQMQREKLEFDQFSLSAALSAAANLASLEEGQQIHCLATKLGFDSNSFVGNATMDMYGKCGEMNDVLKIFPEPNMRPRLSWNVLISVFARHGLFQKARDTFHDMVKQGSKPDHVTFVSLLSACSHGGLVDEGLRYFASMASEFGVPAGIEHCVCVVDLLGRSGRFPEAIAFIKEMPVPPNDFVWRSLLAACRMHGNTELGKVAAENLLKSNPSDDSAYVLYSNMCATSGRWQDVQNVRAEMESHKVKKQLACSWVKLKNQICTFGIGDLSHPKSEKIYGKLTELRKKIQEAGYIADTSFALHDTDEEQKEHNLWMHSERLALAYGLISTPEGSTLRIFKNLRVCGDCHSVFKFASSIIRREIILRDPYRFHHFSGGQCSCGDYW
ncbi:PREDICTED: pentatricopeptide repeat-containing protein At3g24000, mitochondrial [Nicotiana attenuata]|uniref:Pentatricopeptide repeat-containing protein n=1 Tax=Nicotiana attenuata TaxID=49451 RepID=A0A314LAL6_NICAT|nr:PREDICTED: pentatricopeptide repeat-containing protein At3g24000, mitochondrial [Nicotiana attenuata]OIT38119.1 pentatricopeptide repeat-containing protein [Nicotiana attenuata]